MLQLPAKLIALLCVFLTATAAAEDLCILQEPLGQSWHNELITIPLSPAQLQSLQDQHVLVGPDNRIIPHQIVTRPPGPTVAFQISLQPYQSLTLRLVPSGTALPATATNSVAPKISELPDRIILENSVAGVTLLKSATGKQSPLSSFLTPSGQWTQPATLTTVRKIIDCKCRITARGPVFVEAHFEARFEGDGQWTGTCRVLAGEPVVLIEESQQLDPGGELVVPLTGDKFQPTHLLHRFGKGDLGRLATWPLADGEAFLLEPWLRWWMNERQGNWFALYSTTAERMLMVAALTPSRWRQPSDPAVSPPPLQMPPQASAVCRNEQLTLYFPLGAGSRSWMVACPPQHSSTALLDSNNLSITPDCQQLVIRHGDFPFDQVRQWVLDWPGDHDSYPRLFLSRGSLQQLRSSLPLDPAEVRRWTSQQPIDKYNIEAPLRAWFASQDLQLEAALIARCEEWLNAVIIDALLKQHGKPAPGVAPHSQSVLLLPALNLADAVLSAPSLTPTRRKRILAQLAFFGYAVSRDDYWSVARGYSANPNMTTTVSLYRTLAASLIPSHPAARQWAETGLQELQRQLRDWSDPDGGWLEAPHYAMVSLDHMVGAFLMARNNGFSDSLYDPQLKKVFEWLAQISTPPDSGTGGFRRYPAIGHTYHGEGTGMFGIMAGLWRERDPEFAGRMQWMYEQQGKQPIGLFGPFGTFSGYRSLLLSHSVQPIPMELTSRWFRNTGVVLRSHAGTERESCLTLIAGPNHEHYDNDSGSITLWGLGRVLADDFGYVGAHPAKFHSLPEWSGIQPTNGPPSVMTIQQFASGRHLDYVSGIREGWRREIAFLKNPQPAGNVGFLLHDQLPPPVSGTWRLWLTGERLELPGSGRAVLIGQDDVDLEIYFWPTTTRLTSEPGEAQGMVRRNGKEERQTTRQLALQAELQAGGHVSAFLWPRKKQTAPPEVLWFANGRGVQVSDTDGISYLSLPAPALQRSPDQQARFTGAAAAVHKQDGRLHTTLAGAATVSAWGHTTTSTAAGVTEDSVSLPRK